jgi:predicted Zn-dependent protease
MTDRLREVLAARAGRDWELYRKTADSRERTSTAAMRRESSRREEGWAARWWEEGAPRFCAATSPEALAAGIPSAGRVPTAAADPLPWPTVTAAPAPPVTLSPLADLFDDLARQVAAESRGEATLSRLTVRQGVRSEWIENGSGLNVSDAASRQDGFAAATGRRGTRARDAVVVFRWDGAPEIPSLARRISDRVTLPLADRGAPFDRGEWLLDPSVSAALLAALTPLFTGEARVRSRSGYPVFSRRVQVVDDATADARFDGEGTPTRRVALVEEGSLRAALRDLAAARRTGEPSTGHGVRASYRTPPQLSPRRLFFASDRGEAPAELLSRVRRGIFAAAPTAPVLADLEADRFEVEFTGVAVIAGRAQAPVAAARASGRLSELLVRIAALGTDRQFFSHPHPVGAPTLLVERASFE